MLYRPVLHGNWNALSLARSALKDKFPMPTVLLTTVLQNRQVFLPDPVFFVTVTNKIRRPRGQPMWRGSLWLIIIIPIVTSLKINLIYFNPPPQLMRFIYVFPCYVQGFQLKSGPCFNMSNLFIKIYNMLYYTTNLYLQCTYRHVSPCSSQLFLAFFHFLTIFAIALFTGAYLLNFSNKLCLQWA